MRRMMHAAAIVILFGSTVQAQVGSVRPLPPMPTGDRSPVASPSDAISTESSNDSSSLSEAKGHHVGMNAGTMHASEFMAYDSGRPFSALAVRMNCSDASPNLWCGYSSQRAELAARVMRHVDGQCNCYSCRSSLHARSCGGDCGANGCNTCGQGGCDRAVRNRYKQQFSTIYSAPSTDCGNGCGARCRRSANCINAGCSDQSPCSACNGDILGSSLYPPTSGHRNTMAPSNRIAHPDPIRMTPSLLPHRR
jgi:hypothetical protein